MTVFFVDKTLRQLVNQVSDEHYTMTATVIAASAAQAAALGEACMQISLDHQVDTLDWQDVMTRIEQMAHFKDTLLEWCNQEIAPQPGETTNGSQANSRGLFDYAVEVGQLSIQAAKTLQAFRPLVYAQVAGDLEVTINMLAGAARTALLLLDVQQRAEPELFQEYEPALLNLETQINLLTPADRK
jgi:hypothetical protein